MRALVLQINPHLSGGPLIRVLEVHNLRAGFGWTIDLHYSCTFRIRSFTLCELEQISMQSNNLLRAVSALEELNIKWPGGTNANSQGLRRQDGDGERCISC